MAAMMNGFRIQSRVSPSSDNSSDELIQKIGMVSNFFLANHAGYPASFVQIYVGRVLVEHPVTRAILLAFAPALGPAIQYGDNKYHPDRLFLSDQSITPADVAATLAWMNEMIRAPTTDTYWRAFKPSNPLGTIVGMFRCFILMGMNVAASDMRRVIFKRMMTKTLKLPVIRGFWSAEKAAGRTNGLFLYLLSQNVRKNVLESSDPAKWKTLVEEYLQEDDNQQLLEMCLTKDRAWEGRVAVLCQV